MKRIYLACPYWHENPEIRQARYEKVTAKAGELMDIDTIIFSPITHSHPIALTMENQNHEFWLNQDKHYLDWCTELWVFCLCGWKESTGVAWEIDYITKQRKPVWYVGR